MRDVLPDSQKAGQGAQLDVLPEIPKELGPVTDWEGDHSLVKRKSYDEATTEQQINSDQVAYLAAFYVNSLIANQLGKPLRVLDIGSNYGYNSRRAAWDLHRNASLEEFLSIDIDEETIRIATERNAVPPNMRFEYVPKGEVIPYAGADLTMAYFVEQVIYSPRELYALYSQVHAATAPNGYFVTMGINTAAIEQSLMSDPAVAYNNYRFFRPNGQRGVMEGLHFGNQIFNFHPETNSREQVIVLNDYYYPMDFKKKYLAMAGFEVTLVANLGVNLMDKWGLGNFIRARLQGEEAKLSMDLSPEFRSASPLYQIVVCQAKDISTEF